MDDKIDWKRLVVLTAIHGERYLAWTPEGKEEDPKEYIDGRAGIGLPVELAEVRNFITQIEPNIGPQGVVLGVSKMMALMPLEGLIGPLSTLHVIASSWYFPGECGDECKSRIEQLIKRAIESERRMSAAEAGIIPASFIPPRTQ